MSVHSIVSEKIQETALQFVDGTLLHNPRFFKKLHDGYGFSVSHRFEGVSTGDEVAIYFKNPDGSSIKIYIIVIEIVSTGQGWADIFRDNTVTVSGTSISPVNLNLGSSINSVVNAEYGGTYKTGNKVHETVVPGGSRIMAIGGAAEVGESVIIPEDNDILVKATNKSASAEDISIRIIWWEDVI